MNLYTKSGGRRLSAISLAAMLLAGGCDSSGKGNGTAKPVDSASSVGTAAPQDEAASPGTIGSSPPIGNGEASGGSSPPLSSPTTGGSADPITYSLEPCKQGVQPISGAAANTNIFERTAQSQGKTLQGIEAISVKRIVDMAGYGYRFGASYALADDGALYAWGMQDYTVSITGTAYPVRVEGVPAMKATEGDYAIDTGGQVWFLDGGKAKPRKLEGLDRVKSMRQSGENSLIALKEDGSVWTWRHVYQYQEGKGEQWEDTLNSVQTANAKDVFAGMQLGYVLQPDGTLAIVPFEPKLPRESKSSIVKLSGSSKIVRAEAATDYSSVFLLADNGEWHRYDENTGSIELLEGLQSALKITGGELFTLALMKDGTVRGWGSRQELLQPEGMKAEDVMDDSAPSLPQWKITPAMSIRIQGLSDIADIQAGSDHALALRKDGTVLSWGSNSTGQLGRMLNGASQPIQVGCLRMERLPYSLAGKGPTF